MKLSECTSFGLLHYVYPIQNDIENGVETGKKKRASGTSAESLGQLWTTTMSSYKAVPSRQSWNENMDPLA